MIYFLELITIRIWEQEEAVWQCMGKMALIVPYMPSIRFSLRLIKAATSSVAFTSPPLISKKCALPQGISMAERLLQSESAKTDFACLLKILHIKIWDTSIIKSSLRHFCAAVVAHLLHTDTLIRAGRIAVIYPQKSTNF